MSSTPWASKQLRTLRELHEAGKLRPISIRYAQGLCRRGIWHAKKVSGKYYTSEHEFHQWLWNYCANKPFKKYTVMSWHKQRGGKPPNPPIWSAF